LVRNTINISCGIDQCSVILSQLYGEYQVYLIMFSMW